MSIRNTKYASRLRRSAALLILLVFCCQMIFIPAAAETTEAAESTEPVESVEPAESKDAAEAAEPEEPAEPEESAEPEEPEEAAEPEESPEPVEYDGMKLEKFKQARVFQGTLDSVYTLSTWEFKEEQDIPYVSLKEYLNLLFVETYDPGLDFAWDGDVLLAMRNDVSLRVDTVKQLVSVDDMSEFIGPHAAGALADGIVEKEEFIAIRPSEKNKSTQTPANGYEVKLADYGIKMFRHEDDVLIPFAVAQAIFAAPAMRAFFAYNGDDYYDIVNNAESIYGSSQMTAAPNPYANMWYSGSFAHRTELSEEYAKYNYAAMCILLDLTYGHKEEKGITDFDSYLSENGLKEALLSADPKDDVEPLKKLFTILFDSGHDAEILSPSIIDSDGAIGRAEMIHELLKKFGYDSLADLSEDLTPLFYALLKVLPKGFLQENLNPKDGEDPVLGPNVAKIITDMVRLQILKPLGYKASQVNIVGDTCVIYFEGFKEDLTRPESFYTKVPTKSDLETSSFGLFYYAFEQIKANGNVKNVVIDLSNNGGGSAAALVATLGFLSPDGEVHISYRDLLNQNYREEYYHVDTNLDGRFDDEDGYGGQYKFYVLTSGTSYSCANAFPYFTQLQNLATIVGEKPGGGDCVVAYYIDAYGHVGAISGFKQLGTMDGDTFISDESAVVVDIPFTGDEGDGIYFRPEKITQFVANHAA